MIGALWYPSLEEHGIITYHHHGVPPRSTQNHKFNEENRDLPANFGRSPIFKQPYRKPHAESWRYSVYLSVVFSHPITGQVGSLGVILGERFTWQIHIVLHMYLRAILVEQVTVYTILHI